MALNFNLLNTELPGQIATGAMRGYQGAQDRATELAQRQQQSQLNALKISEAQRTEQSQNALNKAYRESVTPTGTTDYNKLIGSLAAGGVGEKIPAIRKAQTEQLTAQSAQQKAKIDLLDASLKQARSFLDTINPADPNAPALYRQWHRANHSHPVIGPVLASRGVTVEQSDAQIEQAIAQGPQAFADLINKSRLGTEKFMEMNKKQLVTTDIGGQVLSRTFSPLTGKLETVGTQAKTMAPGEAQRIKNEGIRIGLEGRRVAVSEENARRDADPTFQQRMAEAKAIGQQIGKGNTEALQLLPKVINRAEESLKLVDELIGEAPVKDKNGKVIKSGTKPHPGFTNAVGATWLPGLRFVPGTDEAGFMARYDQIKDASFLEAFEALKGGGAITEKEGTKATSAINRMNIATDEKEFMTAARDLQDVVREGVKNAKRKANMTITQTPSNSSATGNLSPAEQTELDQLRKRFGK
jgi:hypothetical protein